MKLLVLSLSVALSIALLEIGLRLLTPYPITKESNKASHPRLGYVTSSALPDVDEHGFRNTGQTLEDADVALVGDSMVYSAGVKTRYAFAPQLAARTGRRVYSVGVGSYGVYHYAVLLDDLRRSGVEDVILALFPSNDTASYCKITALPSFVEFARTAGLSPPPCYSTSAPGRTKSARKWLEQHSALVNAIALMLDRYRDTNGPFLELPSGNVVLLRRAWKNAGATNLELEDRRRVFEDSLQVLRRANRDLAAEGIRFSVVIIPSKELIFHAWAEANDWPEPEAFVRDLAPQVELMARYSDFLDAEGIAHLDATATVLAAFDEELQAGRTLYPTWDDGHPRERGYAAYADAAVELLEKSARQARPLSVGVRTQVAAGSLQLPSQVGASSARSSSAR
jgi:hypothetical protein